METWTPPLVLVVGETGLRATYCDWLLAGGFAVAEAVDGEDAVTATVAELPDLVLADAALSGPVTVVDLCFYFDARGVPVLVADRADADPDAPPRCDGPVVIRPTARSLCDEVRRLLGDRDARPDDETQRGGNDGTPDETGLAGQPGQSLDAPVGRPSES